MASERLNILMVTAWPPDYPAGGVGTVIRTLCGELSLDHKVLVLVNEWDAATLQTERTGGIDIRSLRLRAPYDRNYPLRGFLGWLRDFLSALRQLRALVRSEAIDVVHLHFASSYQYYFRILRVLGSPPYVVTLHGGDTVGFGNQSGADRMLVRWTLRGAARIVAVSKWLAELGEVKFGLTGRVLFIHNGLKPTEFGSAGADRAAAEPALPQHYFVNVANVAYHKGQDVAIRAWSELGRSLPDLHLVLIGDRRDYWEKCEELIRSLDLGDRVHMLGPLPRDQVFRIMGRAMGMVFPSRNEGFGLVLLEAGAMKLATVCSDIPPIKEIVGDGDSALLVPPEDPDAFAEAVIRLAENEGLRKRLGQALYDRVTSEFTSQQMARHYVDLYRDVLKRLPAPPN